MATKRTSASAPTPTGSAQAAGKSAATPAGKPAGKKSTNSRASASTGATTGGGKPAAGKRPANTAKPKKKSTSTVQSESRSRSQSKSDRAAANGHADAATEDAPSVEPEAGDETPSADASSPWGIPFGLGGPPPDLTDLGAFIRNQREVAKLSIRRLAELANVSNPYLSQVERGLRNPSPDILQQVANALRISVESLYVKAGILSEDDREVSSVTEAIEHDPRLSAEQKAALRGVYESFLATGH